MNRKQMNAEAQKLVQKAVEKIDDNPNEVRSYYELSVLLTELKDYEQAKQLLLKASGLFSGKTELDLLNYGLGNVLYSAGDFQKAINYFRVVKGTKLNDNAILMIAQCEYALGDYKRSLAYALTTRNVGVKQLIASNFLALGDFQNARKYFDEVLANEPRNFNATFQRGIIALILDGKEQADSYFEIAQKIDYKSFIKMKGQIIDIQKTIIAKQKK